MILRLNPNDRCCTFDGKWVLGARVLSRSAKSRDRAKSAFDSLKKGTRKNPFSVSKIFNYGIPDNGHTASRHSLSAGDGLLQR